jgi:hypothetical protein
VIIGVHGAQAQTPIPPSPKDFVMAESQSDQYEVLAASWPQYKARIAAFEHLLRR